MRIPKHLIRRFAGSDEWATAVAELVKVGFWRDDGSAYVVVHHGDVFRSSLIAQQKARETSKRTSAKHRAKQKASTDTGADLTDDVTRHVTHNPVRQTDKQPRKGGESLSGNGAVEADPWAAACVHQMPLPASVHFVLFRLPAPEPRTTLDHDHPDHQCRPASGPQCRIARTTWTTWTTRDRTLDPGQHLEDDASRSGAK